MKKIFSLLLAIFLIAGSFLSPNMAYAEYSTESTSDIAWVSGGKVRVHNPNLLWTSNSGNGLNYANLVNGWHSTAVAHSIWTLVASDDGGVNGTICYCIAPGILWPTYGDYNTYDVNIKPSSYLTNVASSNPYLSSDEISTILSLVIGNGYVGKITGWKDVQQTDASHLAMYGKIWATQILVWETVIGERDANFNHIDVPSGKDTTKSIFPKTNDTGVNVYSYFSASYDAIEKAVKESINGPSFASKTESKETGNSYKLSNVSGTYTLELTDTNGVLDGYEIESSDGLSVTKSGNKLTITSSSALTSVKEIKLKRTNNSNAFLVLTTETGTFSPTGLSTQPCVIPRESVTSISHAYLYLEPNAGEIQVSKVSSNKSLTNGNSNFSLAGAEYTVYSDLDCKNAIGVITTDKDGKGSIINGVVAGNTYYVKETKASKGFGLDKTVYTVTPNGTGTESAVINSTEALKQGEVKINKTSANPSCTNNNPNYSLEGAVYGVYSDTNCSSLIGKITTDKDGKGSLLSGLYAGVTYYVKEITPSKGYRLDTKTYAVTPSGTDAESAVVSSLEKPYDDPMGIVVNKTDAQGVAIPSTLENTQFTVKYYAVDVSNAYTKDNIVNLTPTRTWVIKTNKETVGDKVYYRTRLGSNYLVAGSSELYFDENGNVVLPAGYITIQETKAAEGYLAETAKVTSDGETVATGNSLIIGKVNVDGTMTLSGLNISNEYVVSNEILYGGFTINKIDAKTNKTPSISDSVSFDLYNKNEYCVVVNGIEYQEGEKVGSFSFKANEYFSSGSILPYGKYQIVETKAPNGYAICNPVDFKIESEDQNLSLSLIDEHDVRDIKVLKTSEDEKLSGLKFILAGKSFFGEAVYMEAVTGEDGIAVFENVEYSNDAGYTITEVDTPDRYEPINSKNIKITKESKDIVTVEFKNVLDRGGFTVGKYDGKTEDAIKEDFEFDLINKNSYSVEVDGKTYAKDEKIASITVKDGIFISEKDYLPYGAYELVETKAPYGWKLEGKTTLTLNITEKNVIENLNTYATGFVDERDTREVRLTKVCEDNIVSGLKFKLAGKNIFAEKVEIIAITDNDGIANFGKVEFSDEDGYTITELETPKRYKSPEPMTVIVNEDSKGIIPITCENLLKKGQIEISKTGIHFTKVVESNDIYTPVFEEKALEGAVFKVTASEDITYADGTLLYEKGEVVETITSGPDGIAKTSLLDFGKYEVEEIDVPDGYTKDQNVYTFDLTPEDMDVTLKTQDVFNAMQSVDIRILKTLEKEDVFNTGNKGEIENIVFGIFAAEDIAAEDGSIIPKDGLVCYQNADKDGYITFKENLPFGKYYAKEIKTDDHYLLSSESYEFNLIPVESDIKTIKIEINEGMPIENKLILGSVHGKKITDDGNELAGAILGLFEEGKEKPTLTTVSDENGYFEFNDIPYGNYIVKETKAPIGYLLDEKEYKVSIKENEALIDLEITDIRIRADIHIIKTDAEDEMKVLSGAVFALYKDINGNGILDEEDALLCEFNEVNEGLYELSSIEYGKYIVVEKAAPKHFKLCEETFAVEVLENGFVYTIANKGDKFINLHDYGTIQFEKPDISPNFNGQLDVAPYTGDNTNLKEYIILAAISLLSIIITAITLIKGKKKGANKVLSLIIFALIIGGAGLLNIQKAYADSYEVVYESYEKEDENMVLERLSNEIADEYKIKDIKYEVIESTNGKVSYKTLTDLVSKDEVKPYLNDPETGFIADFNDITWKETKRVSVRAEQDFEIGSNIPNTKTATVKVGDNEFDVMLKLKNKTTLSRIENHPTTITAKFYEDFDEYLLSGEVVVVSNESPCFEGYKEKILEYMELSPEVYTITGGHWTGDTTEIDGHEYRIAEFDAYCKQIGYYIHAEYEEDITNTINPTVYEAKIKYTNGVEEGKTLYKVKATAEYSLKSSFSKAISNNKAGLLYGGVIGIGAVSFLIYFLKKKKEKKETKK